MSTSEILGFIAEWYDPQPQMMKQFLVKVFTDTADIEIYTKQTNTRFLKKCPLPSNLSLDNFYLGGKINIHHRLMTIIDYGDPYTRRKLSPSSANTCVLLGPDAYFNMGKIMEELTMGSGLKVSKLQSFAFKESELYDLIPLLDIEAPIPHEQLVKFWCSGLSVALELKGTNCHDTVTELVARIRASYGASSLEAAIWLADGLGDFCFGGARRFEPTATLQDCTCGVVRAHAVKSGDFARIIDSVLSSRMFSISAMQMFELDKTSASEFLEVYDGVMPNYKDMVVDLCSGPIIALEVKLAPSGRVDPSSTSVVSAFRDFVGPWDVEMAKELRPTSIRAKFGKGRTENALHCTDLPDDGAAEVSYFFDVLQGS
mmetsp:Transcript_44576/g.90049  ORF Transcript_44576/g.90049 Transcript_44576/m.90049 type:complete len:372 (-) Transcript_44576:165-1280(-)